MAGVVVKRIGRGDFFGETALLSASPRNADVTAHGRVKLWALSKAHLDRAVAAYPLLKAQLGSAMRPDVAKAHIDQLEERVQQKAKRCAKAGARGHSLLDGGHSQCRAPAHRSTAPLAY